MADATHGSVTVDGECLQCGDCCRLMCKDKAMLGEGGVVCRYLTDDNLCAIQLMGKRLRAKLPPDVLAYWTKNCDTYPIYIERQNPQHLRDYLNIVKWPTENCGYTVVIATDGV